ncbi:glutamate-1-semialdehyde 2,1-aminomutase [Dermabacter vaginalis]|uniref:Glutamate-1-semialdehyde 2,1-aminomutase n=1 Tax=Dermabacter vaginalis TaxID=1630135 RepID=A0ABX6A1W1_9MICO|nr:glutamate-1-semialdehyde 2,1-aminomutase [Dermabacter vaginalis]QEU11158.1 glutamate-1-semialdehyde-2,1-aminomutase [Dermabacter vaginalis]
MSTNAELFARAQHSIPGGVNSPVRAFGSVGGTPPYLVSGKGALLTDVEGTEYVDLVGSWGPMILGHADETVVNAVTDAASHSLSFGAPHEGEIRLAELVIDRIPAVDKIRMVNSGTEATMSALRLARGFTGRDLIVKFAGCYHGHVDSLLAEAGSGVATFSLPGSAGVTDPTAAETLVLPYGDREAVHEAFTEHGERIAAVITEGAPCNMGVIDPGDFNAFLLEKAHAAGALLIVDEVLTGFRASATGAHGLDGVVPDLVTFGKVIGGGMPVGAFGGRADIMERLSPLGPVYQAGTLSGNPLATAAGIATLSQLDDALYAQLNESVTTLISAFDDALSAEGVPHTINRFGTLFSVFFTDREVRSYEEAKSQDTNAFARFFHSMLSQGIYLPPSAFEACFVSKAHTPDILDRIITALPAAAKAAASTKE